MRSAVAIDPEIVETLVAQTAMEPVEPPDSLVLAQAAGIVVELFDQLNDYPRGNWSLIALHQREIAGRDAEELRHGGLSHSFALSQPPKRRPRVERLLDHCNNPYNLTAMGRDIPRSYKKVCNNL